MAPCMTFGHDARMTGKRTIEDVAADVLATLDDTADEEFERIEAMSLIERVRYMYLSGECDAFAVALARMTGWSIRGLIDPEAGPVHRVVEAPDGRLLDASGWTDLSALAKRYRLKKPTLGSAGGEERALGWLEALTDDYDQGLSDAVCAIRSFPWAPFAESWFKSLADRPMEGVDIPFPPAATP